MMTRERLDSSGGGGLKRSGGSASHSTANIMNSISECIGELQSSLGSIESSIDTSSSSSSSITTSSPHDKFAATKALFYGLVRLNTLLAYSTKEELLPLEALLVQIISTMLTARRLTLSVPFRRSLCDFYAIMLSRSTTVNLYMVTKDMQTILLSSKTVPVLSRVAALEILTRIFRLRPRQLSPGLVADMMGSILKQLKSSELTLREAALGAIAAGGVSGKAEIFKALKAAFTDKTPEVKGGLAMCLMGLMRGAEDFQAVSLDSLLTLGLKGLEDPSIQVQLLWAEAIAHFLSVSVAGQVAESKAKIVRAARGETDETDGSNGKSKSNGGGGGGGGNQGGSGSSSSLSSGTVGPPSSSSTSGSSGVDKAVAKLKEMSAATSSSRQRNQPTYYTFESAIQHLISLFLKAIAGAPFSQGGTAAVLVAFLRRHRGGLREDTVQWLLGVLLSTVARPSLPPSSSPAFTSKEDLSTRTCVSHILRSGLSAGSPEIIQLVLYRGLVKLLSPDSNLNSLQLQLVLVEVSNLTRIMADGTAVFSEALIPRCLDLLRHFSYGVRFEAAVTLEAVCHALPHTSTVLLNQTITAVRQEYEALAVLAVGGGSSSNGGGGGSGGSNNGEEDEGEKGPSRTSSPVPSNLQPEVRRSKSLEAERRYRICALHGNSNALVMLLKGLKALDIGVPPVLLEDAMAVGKQLVNQQFSPQMRKWATCVRAGWSILSAILHQGAEAAQYVRALFQLSGQSTKLEAALISLTNCLPVYLPTKQRAKAAEYGADWAVKYVRVLFQLFGRSMELEANRTISEVAEPSNLLESMLGTVLVFVRECPEVLWTTPGALTATVELLDKNLELIQTRFLIPHPNKQPPTNLGTILRLTLVKAMIMEAYAWLPPGSYPASSEILYQWSVTAMIELMSASGGLEKGSSGGSGSSNGPTIAASSTTTSSSLPSTSSSSAGGASSAGQGGGPVGGGHGLGGGGASSLLDPAVESSLLPELVREEDAPLDYKSTSRGSVTCSISGSSTSTYAHVLGMEVELSSDLLAMYVHTHGVPLEDREKDASISSGAVGSSRRAAIGIHDEPPTPLHANYWVRPPMPHPSSRVRLLDAAICLFSATFGHQSNEWQAQAVERLCALLPPALRGESSSSTSTGMGMIAALTSEDERRRKEEKTALLGRNVATALLAALRGLPAHTDSRLHVEVAWVTRMREALIGLLASPQSLTRRAACESLALLAQKMMSSSSTSSTTNSSRVSPPPSATTQTSSPAIEVTVQLLVEIALRKEPPPSAGSTASMTMLKGVGATLHLGPTPHAYRTAGATFALACLRRSLGPQIRLSSCWSAIQKVMVADVGQPLRTWGLHSLLLLLKSMSLGQTFGVVTLDTLQTLDTMMEILEAHFLGVWASTQQGSEYEPGLLVCLLRLMNALLPMIMDMQPDSPSVARFKAMWEILRHYPDDRVAFECLQFIELLALFSPKDVLVSSSSSATSTTSSTTTAVVDFLRMVLQGGYAHRRLMEAQRLPSSSTSSPHLLSRACVSTALSCLRSIGKREARAFRRQQLEVSLLAAYDAVASSLHWDQAPFWRAVAIPRELEKAYYGRDLLLDDIRASMDVMVGADNRRPLHYILLARAVILGASHASGGGTLVNEPSLPSSLMSKRDSAPHPGLEGEEEGEGGREGVVSIPDSMRLKAAELVASGGLPFSRWQVKAMALEAALQALRIIQDASSASTTTVGPPTPFPNYTSHSRATSFSSKSLSSTITTTNLISLARQLAQKGGKEVEEGGGLIGLFLEDLIAMGCSAAAALVDDVGLPSLQYMGVVLLRSLIRLFGQVPDPDVAQPLPSTTIEQAGGGVESSLSSSSPPCTLVLAQYTSQLTSALTPSLTSRACPRLVEAACDFVLAGLATGLFEDPVVIRRLINQILPSPDLLLLDPQQPPPEPSSSGVIMIPIPSDLPAATALRLHNVRLRATAEALVLARLSPLALPPDARGPSAPAKEVLEKLLVGKKGYAEGLMAHWLGAIKDAIRLQEGTEYWPSLGERAVRLGGCTYDETCDASRLVSTYLPSWPVMVAAAASLAHDQGDEGKEAEKSQQRQRQQHHFYLLLAIIDCFIQHAADDSTPVTPSASAAAAATVRRGGGGGSLPLYTRHETPIPMGTGPDMTTSGAAEGALLGGGGWHSHHQDEEHEHLPLMYLLMGSSALFSLLPSSSLQQQQQDKDAAAARAIAPSSSASSCSSSSTSIISPSKLARFLRALVHGPSLRLEAHPDLRLTAIRFINGLLLQGGREGREGDSGFSLLRQLLLLEQSTSVVTTTEKEEGEEEGDEDEEEGEEGVEGGAGCSRSSSSSSSNSSSSSSSSKELWLAVLEVVFVPICRLLPELFAGDYIDGEEESDEQEEAGGRPSPSSSSVASSSGSQSQENELLQQLEQGEQEEEGEEAWGDFSASSSPPRQQQQQQQLLLQSSSSMHHPPLLSSHNQFRSFHGIERSSLLSTPPSLECLRTVEALPSLCPPHLRSIYLPTFMTSAVRAIKLALDEGGIEDEKVATALIHSACSTLLACSSAAASAPLASSASNEEGQGPVDQEGEGKEERREENLVLPFKDAIQQMTSSLIHLFHRLDGEGGGQAAAGLTSSNSFSFNAASFSSPHPASVGTSSTTATTTAAAATNTTSTTSMQQRLFVIGLEAWIKLLEDIYPSTSTPLQQQQAEVSEGVEGEEGIVVVIHLLRSMASALSSPTASMGGKMLVVRAIRSALQSRSSRASEILQCFGPVALQALYEGEEILFNSLDAGGEGLSDGEAYLIEAVKVVLLGFTGLTSRVPPHDPPTLKRLQGQHLALTFPALSGLLATIQNQSSSSSATASGNSSSNRGGFNKPHHAFSSQSALKTLISQALLSVARTAPGPFKEQVQLLPQASKTVLETALRAAATGGSNCGGSAGGGSTSSSSSWSVGAPKAALKIDMTQYK